MYRNLKFLHMIDFFSTDTIRESVTNIRYGFVPSKSILVLCQFLVLQIKPEDMRAFFVPAGKGVYFHPGTLLQDKICQIKVFDRQVVKFPSGTWHNEVYISPGHAPATFFTRLHSSTKWTSTPKIWFVFWKICKQHHHPDVSQAGQSPRAGLRLLGGWVWGHFEASTKSGMKI